MNTRLFVLGLLTWGPKHGYEIQKWATEREAERWADVRSGSIYHALGQLQREGRIAVQHTEQTGHRLRATYAITDAGRDEFARLLRQGWQRPPASFPADLYLLITFLHQATPEEVLAGIAQMLATLERELHGWTVGETYKSRQGPLAPAAVAMFENGRAHLEADVRFLRRLQELLADGRPITDL